VLPSSETTRALPVYVEPALDEALISWLLRLASRLEISPQVLASEGLGLTASDERWRWWLPLHPWVFKRMSDKTGVPVERLRQMTLASWAPDYRNDLEDERFAYRQACQGTGRVGEKRRQARFVFCPECLTADQQPFVRLSWTIGWVALCPLHITRLVTRCERCQVKLRFPLHSWMGAFLPQTCLQCRDAVSFEAPLSAHLSVLKLQQALLRGKRDGVVELDGLRPLSWQEFISLADIWVDIFWNDHLPHDTEGFRKQFEVDFSLESSEPSDRRYRSLALLGWFLEGWPSGAGPQLARDILARWLEGAYGSSQALRRNSRRSRPWHLRGQEIEPEIRASLRTLL
jgi:hypothetical protein